VLGRWWVQPAGRREVGDACTVAERPHVRKPLDSQCLVYFDAPTLVEREAEALVCRVGGYSRRPDDGTGAEAAAVQAKVWVRRRPPSESTAGASPTDVSVVLTRMSTPLPASRRAA